MVTFRDYLLEYAIKPESITSGVVSMKARTVSGNNNGKNRNSPNNGSVIAKQYKHKHPIVDSVLQGKSDNVRLNSVQLSQILKQYDTDFDTSGKPKTLGNSNVEVVMSKDKVGNIVGILRKKIKQNGM